ncbi:MAG: hypothetical protein R3C68_09715 [Myxococcota bacterium]
MVVGGTATDSSKPRGVAPIAAMSDKLTAAALCPTSAQRAQDQRKSTDSINVSVLTAISQATQNSGVIPDADTDRRADDAIALTQKCQQTTFA